MRVAPTPRLGVAIGLGYIAAIIGLWVALGADMRRLDSADGVRPFAIGLGITSVGLTVLASWLGWWPAILRDGRRLGGVLRFVPVLWLVVIGLAIALGEAGSIGTDRLLWTAALAVAVGYSEELAYRGLVLTGLRGVGDDRWPERRVWLVSTALFAVLHLPNLLVGLEPVAAVVQTALAFLGGTALYLVRRTTGTLAAAVLLHGLWDFAAFTGGASIATVAQLGTNVLVFAVFLLTLKRTFESPTA